MIKLYFFTYLQILLFPFTTLLCKFVEKFEFIFSSELLKMQVVLQMIPNTDFLIEIRITQLMTSSSETEFEFFFIRGSKY